MSIPLGEMFKSGPTWPGHALADSERVLALPFLQLVPHLLHLGWVQGPEAAFPRSTATFVVHFLEALVERQVMADRVLPAIRSCLMK